MNERNNKLELLGSAPIPKALMALGIPIMIGMLINALYNLVDAYFVAGLGKSQMGAISIVFPLAQKTHWCMDMTSLCRIMKRLHGLKGNIG